MNRARPPWSHARAPAFALATALAAAQLASSSSAHAQPVVNAEAAAQVRFSRGRDAFMARDFATALTEFRAANELTASPNTRLYIARCLRELNRLAEASLEFSRASAEASDRANSEPRYAATRDAARTEGAALQPRLGRLSVRVPHAPPNVQVLVGGHPLPSAGWDVPTPVDPGEVEISATAPGRLPFHTRVTVQPGVETGATVELAVDPGSSGLATPPTLANSGTPNSGTPNSSTPNSGHVDTERPPAHDPAVDPPRVAPPTRERRVTEGGGVRIAGGVVLGVGALGGIGFLGFGLLARSRYDALLMQCGPITGMTCGSSAEVDISQGERYQTLANVSLGVGLAGVAAGIIMVAVGGPRERVITEEATDGAGPSTARAPRREPGASLRAWVAPGGIDGATVAGVRGAF